MVRPGGTGSVVTRLQQPPALFAAGLEQLHAALVRVHRPGLGLHEVPAPRRLAPWSAAVAAQVTRDGDDVAGGRFVVLHDPDGQQGWDGTTRVVAYVQAQVEAEMAADPALADAGWSWLLDALEAHAAERTSLGGTVTRTVSTRFGQLAPDDADDQADDHADDPDSADAEEVSEVELRASWTLVPGAGGLDLGAHLLAFCDVLCATAGLPPPGVAALRPR